MRLLGPPMMLPITLTADAPDRRHRPRLKLTYPLHLYRAGEAFRTETTTEDLSCEGFFCFTDSLFSPTETLECELLIPAEEQGEQAEHDILLHCRAQVVRVVLQADNVTFGVACRLSDYTIDREMVEETLAMEYAS